MSKEVVIYSVNNEQRFATPINEGSKRVLKLMGDDYVTLKFSVYSPIDFVVGDYADIISADKDGNDVNFGRFEIVELQQQPSQNASTGGYDYELKLEAQYKKWRNKLHKFQPQTGSQECEWSLTSTIEVHAEQILHSLNTLAYGTEQSSAFLIEATTNKNTGDTTVQSTGVDTATANNPLYLYNGEQAYKVVIQSNVDKSAKTITYSQVNILDAIADIAEAYDCEYWIEGNTLYFGKCDDSADKEYIIWETGYELDSISASKSSESIATRIIPFGSTTNISARYRKDLIFTADSVNGNTFCDTERTLRSTWFCTGEDAEGKSATGNKMPTAVTFTTDLLQTEPFSVYEPLKTPTVSLGTLAAGAYTFRVSELKPALKVSGGARIHYGQITYTVTGYTDEARTQKYAWGVISSFDAGGEGTEQIANSMFSDCGNLEFETKKLYDAVFSAKVEINAEYTDGAQLTIYLYQSTYDVAYTEYSLIGGIHVTNLRTGEQSICTFENGNFTAISGACDIEEGDTFTVDKDDLYYGFVSSSYYTSRYGAEDSNIIVNGIVDSRLMLPADGLPYIDLYEGMSEQQAIEDVVIFEDIYPSYQDYIREIRTVTRTYKQQDEAGNEVTKTYTAYQIRGDLFTNRAWSNSYIVENKTLSVTFGDGEIWAIGDVREDGTTVKEGDAEVGAYKDANSGKLNGWTFDVDVKRLPVDESNPSGATTVFFELVRDSNNNVPNEFLAPNLHDGFNLVNFDAYCIDEVLVEEAEKKLKIAAQAYVDKINVDANSYTCSAMSDMASAASVYRSSAAAHPNLAAGTRQNFYSTKLANADLYTVEGLAKGDTFTLSAIIELQNIDFSATNAAVQITAGSAYGSKVIAMYSKNGLFKITECTTLTTRTSAKSTFRLVCKNVKALSGRIPSIRIKEFKVESGATPTAYTPTLAEIEAAEASIASAHLGAHVRLQNSGYFGNSTPYRDSRIIGAEIDLDRPYNTPQFTVGEKASYSKTGTISDNLDALSYAIKSLKARQNQLAQNSSTSTTNSSTGNTTTIISGTSGSDFALIASYDTAAEADDTGVFTAARTLKEIKGATVQKATEAEHAVSADTATMAQSAAEATHATSADKATKADTAAKADLAAKATTADDSDKWDGKHFDDYLDQAVKSDSAVEFGTAEIKDLVAEELTVRDKITTDELEAEGNIYSNSSVSASKITTPTFEASLTGSGGGMIVESGKANLYIDNIYARGALNVVSLIISEVKSVGGVLLVTKASGTVEKVTIAKLSSGVTIGIVATLKGENQFVAGDLVRWGKNTYNTATGALTRAVGWYEVTKVDGNDVYITSSDTKIAQQIILSGLTAGIDLVLLGNTSDVSRQGAIIIATEDYGESVRVYSGISSAVLPSPKAVLGSLDSITDSDFTDMSGYGLYAESAWLKGTLKVVGKNKAYQSIEDYVADSASAVLEVVDDRISAKVATFADTPDNLVNAPHYTQDISSDGYLTDTSKVYLTQPIAYGTRITVRLVGHFGNYDIDLALGDWNSTGKRLYGSKNGRERTPDYTGGIDGEQITISLDYPCELEDATATLFAVRTRAIDDSGNVYYDSACCLQYMAVCIGESVPVGTQLKDSGIDIVGGKTTVTSDNFVVQNNSGAQTMLVDANGLLTAQLINVIELTVERLMAVYNSRLVSSYNVNGDGALVFYYPESLLVPDAPPTPMLRLYPESEDSVMQYYDTDGVELWHVGKNGLFEQNNDVTYEKRIVTKGLTEDEAKVFANYHLDSRTMTVYISHSSTSSKNGIWYKDNMTTICDADTYYDTYLTRDDVNTDQANGVYAYTRHSYTINSAGKCSGVGLYQITGDY